MQKNILRENNKSPKYNLGDEVYCVYEYYYTKYIGHGYISAINCNNLVFDLINMPQHTNPFYYDVIPAKDEQVYISIEQLEERFLFETLSDAENFISKCKSDSENKAD